MISYGQELQKWYEQLNNTGLPSPTSGFFNGYLPAQREVMGLNQIHNRQKYISAGLGSSASISFLDFRLFNTPEINVIILQST